MNEPKRRGRPPKAKVEELSPAAQAAANTTKATMTLASLRGCEPEAAKYAIRVWNGQTDSLPVRERVARVIRALRGQNLVPAEPTPDQREQIIAMLAAQGISVKSIEL